VTDEYGDEALPPEEGGGEGGGDDEGAGPETVPR
jgi:hypothetical protein